MRRYHWEGEKANDEKNCSRTRKTNISPDADFDSQKDHGPRKKKGKEKGGRKSISSTQKEDANVSKRKRPRPSSSWKLQSLLSGRSERKKWVRGLEKKGEFKKPSTRETRGICGIFKKKTDSFARCPGRKSDGFGPKRKKITSFKDSTNLNNPGQGAEKSRSNKKTITPGKDKKTWEEKKASRSRRGQVTSPRTKRIRVWKKKKRTKKTESANEKGGKLSSEGGERGRPKAKWWSPR